MKSLACLATARWLSWEDKIAYLAYQIKPMESTLPPIDHRFEDGWYIRVFRMPAGVVFIGRPHNLGHICKLISGKLAIMHELGQKYYEGPATLLTKPGYQMVLMSQTDILAETRHPNPLELRDINALEAEIFGSAEEVLDRGRVIAAQFDYKEMIAQHGLSEDTIQKLMTTAYVDGLLDTGQEKVMIADSQINGRGCYALVAMGEGDTIAVASVGQRGTAAGRYTNHSPEPNARPEKVDDTGYFIALRPIAEGEEITVNYRQVLKVVSA